VVLVAAGSPRPFSFRARAALVRARLEQAEAVRLLAGRQVDQTHLALSLFHLALRLDLDRQAVWSEVY
jgi:hypothetical protein